MAGCHTGGTFLHTCGVCGLGVAECLIWPVSIAVVAGTGAFAIQAPRGPAQREKTRPRSLFGQVSVNVYGGRAPAVLAEPRVDLAIYRPRRVAPGRKGLCCCSDRAARDSALAPRTRAAPDGKRRDHGRRRSEAGQACLRATTDGSGSTHDSGAGRRAPNSQMVQSVVAPLLVRNAVRAEGRDAKPAPRAVIGRAHRARVTADAHDRGIAPADRARG
jgi:hypothetical protein